MSELIVIKNPFDPRARDQCRVEGGRTVDALVGEYLPAGTPDGTEIVVVINGQVVPRGAWAVRVLAPGEQLVAMPRVRGGDDGLLGTVLSIALMVVAPMIGAAMASAMGLGTIATIGAYSLTWGTVIGAGIGLLGSALIGALTAPDMSQLPSRSLQSYDASPSYAWNPATTQEPGGVISRAYGTVKLFGNVIGGYVQSTGDTGREQVANLLIDLGLGPYSQLRDFKINDQALDNYSGVTVIARMGHLTQDLIPAFDDTTLTRAVGAKVVKGAPVTRTTAGSDFNALDIQLAFPNGLWHSSDSGGLDQVSVRYTVEISDDSGATWRHVATTPRTESATVMTNQWVTGWGSESGFTVLQSGSRVLADHYEGEYWTDGWSGGFWHWLQIATTVYTDYDEDITTAAASTQPIRKIFRADHLTRGLTYQVRVTNLSDDQTSSRYGDDLYLSEINEILYDDFTYPRTALAAVRALATDQLSGSLRFECIADAAIVRVWNGSTWASAWSNNPAWVAWDILTQPVLDNSLAVARYDGLNPSRLDLDAFYAWAQWCDALVPGTAGFEKRCTFDGIFDTPMSNWEAALEVANSARATLLMRGTTVTVVHDHARSTPAQLFTVGNTIAGSFSETFLPMQDRAGAVEVEYIDAANDHQRNKITVVNTAVTEAAAQRVQFANRGIRRASQAWREGMYRLERNRLLKRTAELSADIDAIACTVGDLVWVQNDVTRWGEGGRITSGNVSEVDLDKAITIEAGKSYELHLRLADDTLCTRTLSNPPGTWNFARFADPLPAVPQPCDLWAVGESSRAVKPFIVADIRRNGDQQATLSLIEYNATLYNVDANNPVLPTPDVSAAPELPTISNLVIDEQMVRANDGTIFVHLDAWWDITGGDKADVAVNNANYTTTRSGYQRISNVTSGQTYTITVRAYDYLGRPSPVSVSRSHVVVGKIAPPQTVPWFSVRERLLAWGKVSDIDVAGYALRWTSGATPDWSRGQPLHEGLITESPWEMPIIPVGPAVIMVKAVDTSGNESIDTANIITDLGQPVVANIIDVVDMQGDGFPGQIGGATVSGGSLLADSTDRIWAPSDAVPLWSTDADLMWNLNYYKALSYLDTVTVGATEAGAQMTIVSDISGLGARLEYRYPAGDGAAMWGTDADPMWSDDEAPFRVGAPGWQPWPGAVTAQAGDYDIRARAAFGRVRGRIDALAVRLDVPDIVEYLDDVDIASGGSRLPIVKTYRVIRNVNLTLQDDGGAAAGARVIDKSASPGPLINCYTTAGSATAGRVDAIIQGY